MSSYKVRDWVTIGLFGGLWGVVEMTLGSYLNVIFPSFSNTFFKGVILGAIGAAIVLTGRHFVPRRGAIVFMGLVTALLKLLSPGGNVVGPLVAIVVESVLMEAVLWHSATPRRWAFALGGALAVGWAFPHKFIMMGLLYGVSAAEVYVRMVQDGSETLGLDPSLALLILALLLMIRLIVGGFAGWGAWELSRAVARRLGRRSAAAGDVER
jgi:hypothetical protein